MISLELANNAVLILKLAWLVTILTRNLETDILQKLFSEVSEKLIFWDSQKSEQATDDIQISLTKHQHNWCELKGNSHRVI